MGIASIHVLAGSATQGNLPIVFNARGFNPRPRAGDNMNKGLRLFHLFTNIDVFKKLNKKLLTVTLYKVYTHNMSGKDFVKKLLKDGWELDRVKGSHYILRRGKVTLSVPVHKNEDLGKGLLNELMEKAGYKK